MGDFRPPLQLTVLHHRESAQAVALGQRIYALFARDPSDPMARGLGVPVRYSPVPLDDAVQTAVVALVDDRFALNEQLRGTVRDLWEMTRRSGSPHRLLPVALSTNAYRVVPENQFVRVAPTLDGESREQRLEQELSHELSRLLLNRPRTRESDKEPLSPSPVQLFLSHAKADGVPIVRALDEYISKETALDRFFDSRDITPGFSFAEEIRGQLSRSALVVLQTDAYASREWCRREVLEAKRLGLPIVVVNAVHRGEERSFPYMGNVPTIRVDPDSAPKGAYNGMIVRAVLREVLRSLHSEQQLLALQRAGFLPLDAIAVSRPPEALTLLHAPDDVDTVIYPDPPLGQEEVEVLSSISPRRAIFTPTQALARVVGVPPVDGMRLALSISEPPEEDLARRGLTQAHVRDVAVELARHTLAAGGTLAYGGDLRRDGYLRLLFDLARYYSNPDAKEPIRSFLAWPDWNLLTPEEEASLMGMVDFRRCPEPSVEPWDASLDEDVARRARRVAALRIMRLEMTDQTAARVLIGGRLSGYQGVIPGILEEALSSIDRGRPLFVVGGFGGCAGAISDCLEGMHRLEVDAGRLASGAGFPPELWAARTGLRPVEEVVRHLRAGDVSCLRNGLSADENRRLFRTTNIPEIVGLVMTGMGRLNGSGTPA